MDAAVVIPVGSVSAVLREQVARVLTQHQVSLAEVVLSVNSAERDITHSVRRVVEACGDARVKITDSSARRGAAHARNVGVAATRCTAVAFCDADDLVHDGWLAALVDGLKTFDAVSGRVVDVFPTEGMRRWHPQTTRGGLNSFLGKPYLLSGNLAVRRDAFDAVGGFDEALTRCEDIAFSWSLLRAGYTIGYVDAAVIDYRHRQGVVAMLRQHYSYGRGMSEVLRAFGSPVNDDGKSSLRLAMLRPNGKPRTHRSIIGVARRGAIAAGRLRGLLR